MTATSTLPVRSRRAPATAWDLTDGEVAERFACFGSTCAVIVSGPGREVDAADAAAVTRYRLLAWHRQFSRFEPASELSQLNRDPRQTVPVSPVMAGFVQMALDAAARTGGLIDPALVSEIEQAGYRHHFDAPPVPLRDVLEMAPARKPAAPRHPARWREVRVDLHAGTVTRPPGLRLDGGGLVKGMFADILSWSLGAHDSFLIDAGGDLALGGRAGRVRPVEVSDPFGDGIRHVFELRRGAAATSGIGRRSWLDARGRPAHHLLDAATGRPAFTGIVQVTALAPRAVEAETLAKAALLSGPDGALAWLPHGGLVVYDDGRQDMIAPARRLAA